MLNERIDSIRYAGFEVMQVRFDLADAELRALARSLGAIAAERYRNGELDADAVLALRELITLHDAAYERAEDGYDGGTLVLGVARLALAANALGEWLESRLAADFLRADEATDLPVVERMLDDLRSLHARSLEAALNETVCAA
jgi:hypothetical protein